jgi:hypothetical protein
MNSAVSTAGRPVYLEGNLDNFDLASVAQILLFSRKSGVLRIEDGEAEARVFFADGHIVHAERGPQDGEEAFFSTFRLRSGRFRFHSDVPAPLRTIHKATTFLIMEGVRLADEAGEEGKAPVVFPSRESAAAGAPAQADEEVISDFSAEEAVIRRLEGSEELAAFTLYKGKKLVTFGRSARAVVDDFEAVLTPDGPRVLDDGVAATLLTVGGELGRFLGAGTLRCIHLETPDGVRDLLFSTRGFAVSARLAKGKDPAAAATRLTRQ